MGDFYGSTRRSWYRRLLRFRKKPHHHDEPVSERTLRMIDEAAENYKRGKVGPPVDPERLRRLAT